MNDPHQSDESMVRQIAEAIELQQRHEDDAAVERALDDASDAPPLSEARVRHILNLVHEKEPVMSASRTAASSKVQATLSPVERRTAPPSTERGKRKNTINRNAVDGESTRVGWILASVLLLAVALIAGSFYFGGEGGSEDGNDTGPHGMAASSPRDGAAEVHTTGYWPAVSKMAPRPRREIAATTIAVGDVIITRPGERRRAALPDGSIIYINENTRIEVKHERRLELPRGEVFVEVAQAVDADSGQRRSFVVETPDREVAALGTKFSVSHNDSSTRVLVTQGEVAVAGVKETLTAGQQLLLKGEDAAPDGRGADVRATAAQRASHLLAWTRDLQAAAHSPLVPGSQHAGGALIAVDPYGEEAKLSLRKYHVDVHIEDGFARTTIDQTYFNHQTWRMEGTFYFPLPPDASLSRLAMYVGPKLMEGGMAEREHARDVFEQIVYRQRDPALLEWVDGSTFKMRVFPLEGRQEKRIIISYTQQLPGAYGAQRYRFPAGHNLEGVRDFTVEFRVKDGAKLHWTSPSHELKAASDGDDLVLTGQEHDVKIDKDIVVTLRRGSSDDSSAAFSYQSAVLDGHRYLAVRLRPEVPEVSRRHRRHWVLLFENSGDRDPLLARVQIDVLQSLLENAEHDDTFSLVTAATRTGLFNQEPLACTPENIARATEFLDHVHLVGALDLGQAFSICETLIETDDNAHLVHVGSGVAVLGQREQKPLLDMLPPGAKYVGVGVGKRWDRALMKEAARRTGGYFTQINPDEPVTWRAFELVSALNAPRLLDVRVTADGPWTFHTLADSVIDGEEVFAVARAPQTAPLPKHVQVAAMLDGETYEVELPVDHVQQESGHLPRTWAKQEIDRLVAAGAEANKQKIVELSKATYVMSPFTSLLVLESEEMYKQFDIDRGRKDHWAMYPAPEEIEVVYEPLGPAPSPVAPTTTDDGAEANRPSTGQVLQTINVRIPAKMLYWPNQSDPGYRVLNAWQLLYGGYGVLPHDRQYLLEDEPLSFREESFRTPLYELRELREGQSMDYGWASNRLGELNHRLSTSLDLSSITKYHAVGAKRRPTSGLGISRFSRRSGLQWDFNDDFSGRMPGINGTAMNGPVAPNGQIMLFTDSSSSMQLGPVGKDAILQDWRRKVGGRWWDEQGQAGQSLQSRELITSLGFIVPTSRGMRGSYVEGEGLGANESWGWTESGARTDLRSALQGLAASIQYGSTYVNYQRPTFTGNQNVFVDLLSYAPGMNTTLADLAAVREAEAKPDAPRRVGAIDDGARRLVERARRPEWESIRIKTKGEFASDVTIRHDHAGKYMIERNINGLDEQVLCDGETLWHLYSELGVGSRRTMCAAYRDAYGDVVPWSVAAIEDLARGADVRLLNDHTVALVPLAPVKESTRENQEKDDAPRALALHLVFHKTTGRLSERRVVDQTTDKTLWSIRYGEDGKLSVFDSKGKLVVEEKLSRSKCDAPTMAPADELVVLPLPYRTEQHVIEQVKPKNASNYSEWSEEDALALLAAKLTHDTGGMRAVIAQRFFGQDDRRIGFYTLLLSSGTSWSPAEETKFGTDKAIRYNPTVDHPNSPLAKYVNEILAYYQTGQQQAVAEINHPRSSFIVQLAEFRRLWYEWNSGRARSGDAAHQREMERQTNEYVKACPHPVWAWSLVSAELNYGSRGVYSNAANVLERFRNVPQLAHFSRYERARMLHYLGLHDESAKAFGEAYEVAFKAGLLPPIDRDFRGAMQSSRDGENGWNQFVRKSSRHLLEKNQPTAVVYLAMQCQQVGDAVLAEELLSAALSQVKQPRDNPAVYLWAIRYFWQSGQLPRADVLAASMLEDEKLAGIPALWEFASWIAQQNGKLALSLSRKERAMDIEFRNLPQLINLQAVRQQYGALLAQYQRLADAIATLESEPPADFVERIVIAADRWRYLDEDDTQASQAAANILSSLGRRELAWDYLTTPLAEKPNEAAPWLGMAQNLRSRGEMDLAAKSYALAYEAEPTNAQILWDQSQLLLQMGRRDDARKLLTQLAQGEWQPRFSWIKQQAERSLGQTKP
ncbi:MAG: VIT domain-containing protein [Pirellulaceae bacterium]